MSSEPVKRKAIITIDGPAGAGKSTVSRALAERLSYTYLDTGALYRAFAYKARQECIGAEDDKRLKDMGQKVRMYFRQIDGQQVLFIDDLEITNDLIRTEEISLLASTLSARPCVRQALLAIQRDAGAMGGLIAEGRDMGTVVFPNADFKFFLDAAEGERVQRRYREIGAGSGTENFEQIALGLQMRDKQDREREIAPLRPASNAHIIDSTNMTIEEVLNKIVELISSRKDVII